MTLKEVLESQLRPEEGLRLEPYLDEFGNVTIGWGHNYGKVSLENIKPITRADAERLFQVDINDAIMEAKELVNNFNDLTTNRQSVLSNMAFNLGEHKLSKFTVFIGYVQANRFKAAADDLRNHTLVYKELPTRYEYLAQLMETG